MYTTQSIRVSPGGLGADAGGRMATGCVIVSLVNVLFLGGPAWGALPAQIATAVGLASGTNTPGATIRQLVVPELAGLGMLGLAGLLLMLPTRCRDRQ